MSRIMLINVTHVEESRVAIVEDGVLAAYEIETINRTSIKGNIYNSVVESTHTSLEAAFLRISPDLKGFLPLDEVNFRLLPQRRDDRARGKIGQHLHSGQRLITQVVREPFGGKPPTVSTFFSLPGRYLVLMPGVDSGGISRKIEDSSQRDRLKKISAELKLPDGFGIIIRTAGLGQTKTELQRDLRYLLRLWESIQKGSGGSEFPALVYQERDLVIRTIRDHFTPDISEVWIDNPETHQRALDFVRDVMPTKAKAIKLYSGDRPLFNKFNLEEQIERIYKRRVPLPSGGEIVIDGTEALTAIDVNSARSSRGADAEENATQTNLEAAREISRQLRLRDLGGLVVADFIDMSASRNVKKVEKAMRDAMRGDKARYDVTRISKLGLMEISRQRIKGAKLGASYATCPACEGYGLVKNVEAAALSSLRKLQTRCARGDFGKLRLTLPPEVAGWLLNHKRDELVRLERRHDIRIVVEARSELLRHESGFEPSPRDRSEAGPGPAVEDRSLAPSPSEVVPDEAPAAADSESSAPESPMETPTRKKRRRRRRGSVSAPSPSNEPAAESVAASDTGDAASATAPPVVNEGETAADDDSDPGGGSASEDTRPSGPIEGPGDGGDEAGTGGENGSSTEGSAPRKRRRRKRKRGRAGDGSPSPEGTNPDAPDPIEQDDAVPAFVRSDELMPAAVGDRKRSSRSSGKPKSGGGPRTGKSRSDGRRGSRSSGFGE